MSDWQSSFELQSPKCSSHGWSAVQKPVFPAVGAIVTGAKVVGAAVVAPAAKSDLQNSSP